MRTRVVSCAAGCPDMKHLNPNKERVVYLFDDPILVEESGSRRKREAPTTRQEIGPSPKRGRRRFFSYSPIALPDKDFCEGELLPIQPPEASADSSSLLALGGDHGADAARPLPPATSVGAARPRARKPAAIHPRGPHLSALLAAAGSASLAAAGSASSARLPSPVPNVCTAALSQLAKCQAASVTRSQPPAANDVVPAIRPLGAHLAAALRARSASSAPGARVVRSNPAHDAVPTIHHRRAHLGAVLVAARSASSAPDTSSAGPEPHVQRTFVSQIPPVPSSARCSVCVRFFVHTCIVCNRKVCRKHFGRRDSLMACK